MITPETEIKAWVKKLEPQRLIEDIDFNEIVIKYWQGSSKFEGKYIGKIADEIGRIFLCFHKGKTLLFYDSKDLTIGQHQELKKIPGYDE